MKKLYFANTNADTLTIAVDEETGRACYLWDMGDSFGGVYPDHDTLNQGSAEEIAAASENWLHAYAEMAGDFDCMYTDCESGSGYTGTCDAGDALDGCEILAEIEF